MSKYPVELDFFATKSPRSSIRGIQSAISKIDPLLFKSLISSGAGSAARPPSPLPVLSSSTIRCGNGSATAAATAPMTIFYNGAVTILDLRRDKAEAIMKLAEEGSGGGDKKRNIQMPEEDLPIARRKSLQRFLQKRKERLVTPGPYGGGGGSGANSELVVVGSEKEKPMPSNF